MTTTEPPAISAAAKAAARATARAAARAAGDGLRALIETPEVRHERMPMLEVVCERMIRALASSVRALVAETVDIQLLSTASQRFGDEIDALSIPAMIGVVRLDPWHSYGLISADRNLVYAVVDALLGGKRAAAAVPDLPADRAYSAIEVRLVQRVLALVLTEFSAAMARIVPVTAKLERMEANPRFAAIASPGNAVVALRFAMAFDGCGGEFSLIFPYASLEPARQALGQSFMGEEDSGASLWSRHLAQEIRAMQVPVDVLLGTTSMALGTARALCPGDQIRLDSAADAPLVLRCRGQRLAHVRPGQAAGRVAVSLSEAIGPSDQHGHSDEIHEGSLT